MTLASGLNFGLRPSAFALTPAPYMNLRLVGRGVLTPPSAICTSPDLGGALGTARPYQRRFMVPMRGFRSVSAVWFLAVSSGMKVSRGRVFSRRELGT